MVECGPAGADAIPTLQGDSEVIIKGPKKREDGDKRGPAKTRAGR